MESVQGEFNSLHAVLPLSTCTRVLNEESSNYRIVGDVPKTAISLVRFALIRN
jgi:hypothetical protein